jgi:hypothetical protein
MTKVDLKSYNRGGWLLLLFTPSASTDEYIQQWQALFKREAELQSRNVHVMSIFEEEVGDFEGDPIDDDESRAIRQQCRVQRGHAVSMLIDDKGDVRQKTPMPMSLSAIVALIDAPPG